MLRAPEVEETLIDESRSVIWRKVGRVEPGKLVRVIRAGTSRLRSDWRMGVLDAVFPPKRVDYESRPYHLGWVLHTWLGHP